MMKYTMLVLAIAICMTGASAAIIQETHGPVAMPAYVTTPFTLQQLVLPQFNTAQGTLLGVQISFSGTLLGSLKFENLENQPVDMTWTLTGNLSLSQGGTNLVTVGPGTNGGENGLPAWDGVNDYAGQSGRTLTPSASASGNASLSYLFDNLTPYKGTGNVTLMVAANGAASVQGTTGTGQSEFQVSTGVQGIGSATITYTYDNLEVEGPSVPEPASLFALGLGIFLLTSYLRKK